MSELTKVSSWPEVGRASFQGLTEAGSLLSNGTSTAVLGKSHLIDLETDNYTLNLPALTTNDIDKVLRISSVKYGDGVLTINYDDNNNAIDGMPEPITVDTRESMLIQVVSDGGAGAKYTILSRSNTDINNFLKTMPTGDDAGLCVKGGEFCVGEVGDGRETVLGEGDSYPTPLAYHCKVSDTTGNVIVNAIDISDITQSDTGSTTGLFGGVAAGDYLLVGNTIAVSGGFKVKIATAGIIEPENIFGEFLAPGTTWINTNFMAVNDAATPLPIQYGWNICNEDNTSEQWFFGFNPLDRSAVPTQETLNINGQDITAYWGRFRIDSAITQDAVIEQIKSHTNRIEFQANGFQIRYGDARIPRTFTYGLRSTIPNGSANPANETVDYASGFRIAYVDNEFANSAVDGFTFQQEVAIGIDTSIALVVGVSFYVKGTGTGTVDLTLDKVTVADGFVYDGTAPKTTYTPVVPIDITTPQNEVRTTADFLVPINDANVGEALVFNLQRNGPTDGLNNNIVITNIQVTAYQYV